jgi:hypothetical protein
MVLALTLGLVLAGMSGAWAGEKHRIGAGLHYWRTVDDIDVDSIDENGMAYLVTYQYVPAGILRAEIDLEIFPEDFGGSDEAVYAPQALLIVGGGLYAGLGIGVFYSDGDFAEDPFYILRAGLNLELLPNIFVDINGNYHFTDFDDLKDVSDKVDTDTITLGAAVRLAF